MTPRRWHRVREVLYGASCLNGAARLEHLDQHCADDPDLRGEVERLLAALDQCGGFLEPESPAPDESPNLRIGPYLILGQAGRGGMGVVYRAVREDHYCQEVAIKVVRAGIEIDFLVPRFRLERQALALLNHPNIARLLDGGTTTDGWPYLVMEWVNGRPVTEYCRVNNLGVRERLSLFLDICDAVEHAHRKLVVHRDLKPSNILITSEGIPKLLDFGIAKIVSPETPGELPATTLDGVRLLTPDYASPEQLRGEAVTTATDVYSLGAVLYEMLTGRRAVPAEGPLVPCAATNPEGGGLRARELRGDLDNIVLKAMHEEPARRYGSVGQFSDDIRRYLRGLPVIARKDTLAYRMNKFASRHRAGVAAAALLLIAVTAGAATTLWQARVAFEQRGRAERRFNDVRRLANYFLFEFNDAIKSLPGSTHARSLVVKRGLEYLDGLAAEARGDRSLQMEIAAAYQRVGELQGDPMFRNLGDSKGALSSSGKSLAMREALLRADPQNVELRLGMASIHQQMGNILEVTGNFTEAVGHSAKALHIYESLNGILADDPKFQHDIAVQTYQHANLLSRQGDIDGAAVAYKKAVELSARRIAERSSATDAQMDFAASLDGLGGVLQLKGDTAGALDNRRKGLAIREQLAASDPENAHYRRQLAFSHHNVALSLVQAGDLKLALDHFRRELSLFESLSGADPGDAQARRNRSLAHKQIGDVLMRFTDTGAALDQYRKSLDIDRELAAADPTNDQALLDLSFSEGKVGSALGKTGQTAAALALMRTGVARQEFLSAKDPSHQGMYGHLANSYTRLGTCLLESGSPARAADYYRKAVASRLTLSAKNPAVNAYTGALAESYANLGDAMSSLNAAEALAHYAKAIELLDPLAAADPHNAQYRIQLAAAVEHKARLHRSSPK